MELVRTTVFLPKKVHRSLKDLSARKNVSMASLVKSALEKVYFGKKKKLTARDLWGCTPNTHITEEEFNEVKRSLHPRHLEL